MANTNIALGVQPVNLGSGLDRYLKFAQIKQANDNNQMADLEREDYMKARQNKDRILAAAKQYGTNSPEFMKAYGEIDPIAASEYQTGLSAAESAANKDASEIEYKQADTALKKLTALEQLGQSFLAGDRTPERWEQMRQGAYHIGGPGLVNGDPKTGYKGIPQQIDLNWLGTSLGSLKQGREDLENRKVLGANDKLIDSSGNMIAEGNAPDVKPINVINLKMQDGSIKGYSSDDRDGIMSALQSGATEVGAGQRMSVTTADGTVIELGDSSRATQNTVQKGMIETGEMLSALTNITSKFKPEFHSLGASLKAKFNSGLEYIAPGSVQGNDKKFLQEYSSYTADLGRLQAEQVHALYGAALTKYESEQAKTFIVNKSEDPISAQQKLNAYTDFIKRSMAKYAYINKKGLSLEEVSVDEIPDLMEKRGAEIEAEYSKQGYSGETLRQSVRYRLADEFGLSTF